ncbi:hypothetical protein TREMEDRAFT_18693, partial [Tremella mesenterica DSM 1558]|uniref:uncharacterized protein n=1 Tax=Tremella mesenterica (strain ATCC 24925 / CBS 8224 / DSM 1558 / NBRC 9311 / NRRL Y-6157 / RJB 2259-6 / UBC 559-6) TaxID=578456 RepID=UPI0003F49BF3
FSTDKPPSMKDLFEASLMDVIDENGERVRFGDLVRGKRTIVVFIRHWYCPLCAQYLNSIISQVSPQALEKAKVDLVIIGNGSYKMLAGYKKSFRCPFPIYTDPSLTLYRILGLTRQTTSTGPSSSSGDYLVQTPLQSTAQTLKRATKMSISSPGSFSQIGGEFIFDGPLHVSFAHRMKYTKDHAPIRDVCARAGVK